MILNIINYDVCFNYFLGIDWEPDWGLGAGTGTGTGTGEGEGEGEGAGEGLGVLILITLAMPCRYVVSQFS